MVKRWSKETFRPFESDGVFSVNFYSFGTGTPATKSPAARTTGLCSIRLTASSIAAVHGAPARTPGSGNKPANVAAATVVGWAADIEAWTPAPSAMMPAAAMVPAAMMPSMMTAAVPSTMMPAACRGRSRHRGSCADERDGGDESKSEFAEHDPLLIERRACRRAAGEGRLCGGDCPTGYPGRMNEGRMGPSDTVHVRDSAVRETPSLFRNRDLSWGYLSGDRPGKCPREPVPAACCPAVTPL